VPDYDLIIRNGDIFDGTGAPPVRGNVAVRGDRIEAVGDVSGSAAREIDADGRAVSPGFIDVHAHDDAAVVWQPALDFKIMQGVTTDVVGNCGAGVAPANDGFRAAFVRGFGGILGESELPWSTVAEYFAAVDAAHPACNVAAYVPHGVVRANAMGFERREPSPEELDAMRALIEEAMRAGAIGMSTGLVYPPGAYARTQELVELAKAVAKHGGIYTSHIRNETGGRLSPKRAPAASTSPSTSTRTMLPARRSPPCTASAVTPRSSARRRSSPASSTTRRSTKAATSLTSRRISTCRSATPSSASSTRKRARHR
jgi:N-acyl-D-amino-acid deacylase